MIKKRRAKMKIKNIENQIKKIGAKRISENAFQVRDVVIEIYSNPGSEDALFVVVRREMDKNDSMTDYHAGAMYYKIKDVMSRVGYYLKYWSK